MITCHICQSQNITHYRQKRKDGVWVVTARCENGHIPEKGKPFYSIAKFDIVSLPVLPGQEDNLQPVQQLELNPRHAELPETLLEYVERKRNHNDYLHR